MAPSVGSYCFLLGLASGVGLLTLSAYRRVSPRWLQGLLVASGLFVISRYVTMALFTSPEAPQRCWGLHPCWFASSLGLPLASVFAVDQLVRHPAMTPNKLLGRFAPFLLAYSVIVFLAPVQPVADRIAGWSPRLGPGWGAALAIVHGFFVIGFVAITVQLMRKIPTPQIRLGLLALVVGQLALSADGVILAVGGWYVRPYLYSEMFMLLALWYAFETASS
jgi:hypothetical protein